MIGRPIPIVADIPTDSPGLGFPDYVTALADAIRGGEPPQFTVGLYGAWGSGKSSLLKAIAKTLSEPGSHVLTVEFDAWRHERDEHIIVPLLHRIADAAQQAGHQELADWIGRALSALIHSLNFSVAGVSMKVSDVREGWERTGPALDEAFSKPFVELQSLPKKLRGKRIAVLVDDLDRCTADRVVGLLEAINLILDIHGFIFVLALDYDALIEAVKVKYPHLSRRHQFIEKMVQVPFRVPPLATDAPEFLGELIPDWKGRLSELPDGFADSITAVAGIGLGSNPRQVKRLINSFLLLDRIVAQRKLDVDQQLMVAMIGLQLRWPDHYRDLQDGVLGDEVGPFDPLLHSEDEILRRFAQRFFPETPANETMRQLLRLTAVLSTEPLSEDEDGLVASERLGYGERLAAALAERGFVTGADGGRIWSRSDVPDHRIVLRRTKFRLERTSEGPSKWEVVNAWPYVAIEAGLTSVDELLEPRTGDPVKIAPGVMLSSRPLLGDPYEPGSSLPGS